MSSSAQIDNKGKDILIFGEGPSQRLDGTTFPAEAKYHIDFTQSRKRFVLHYYTIMETTVSYLLILQKYIHSKQKNQK